MLNIKKAQIDAHQHYWYAVVLPTHTRARTLTCVRKCDFLTNLLLF